MRVAAVTAGSGISVPPSESYAQNVPLSRAGIKTAVDCPVLPTPLPRPFTSSMAKTKSRTRWHCNQHYFIIYKQAARRRLLHDLSLSTTHEFLYIQHEIPLVSERSYSGGCINGVGFGRAGVGERGNWFSILDVLWNFIDRNRNYCLQCANEML